MTKRGGIITAKEKLLLHGYDETLVLDSDGFEFNESFVGVTEDRRAVYDYELMIDELMKIHSCDKDSAVEWLDCNTLRAIDCMGEQAPIVIKRL